MVEAVIFDMDGLLVESEPLWFRNRRAFVEEHGGRWDASDDRRMAGVGTSVWVDELHARLAGRFTREDVRREILGRMAASYRAGEISVLPGAPEALAACAARYRVGLASGSPQALIEAAMDGTGWRRHFEALLTSDDVAHGKPAPDVYLEVLRRLGVAPARSVVIEDSAGGIRAGKAAGARVVAVPNVHTLPPDEVLAMADARIDTLHALPDTLRGWE